MEKEKVKTWWDEENKIAYIKLIGEFDDEHARIAVQKEREFLDELYERDIKLDKVICDISEAGDATDQAKRIFSSFAKSVADNYKNIKFAYVGKNRIAILVSTFVHKLSGVGDVKFFDSEEKAKKWLINS